MSSFWRVFRLLCVLAYLVCHLAMIPLVVAGQDWDSPEMIALCALAADFGAAFALVTITTRENQARRRRRDLWLAT